MEEIGIVGGSDSDADADADGEELQEFEGSDLRFGAGTKEELCTGRNYWI